MKEDCAERVFATNLDLKSGSTNERSGRFRLEIRSVDDDSSVEVLVASCMALSGLGLVTESLAGRMSELLLELALDLSTGPAFSASLIPSTESGGEVVPDAAFDDDWEDFRRIATGLLLFADVFTWNVVRLRPIFFESL